ncbi:hypothetical protein ES319_A10G154400v1 [Gossypium barbadense]|uniref:Uncharacterized protein n=1 Tax=Gossypium barbadense TaxID=3634 RepID=A0A5J5U3H4_GOSBA|nr:hypothetical protein ES319_A10G154400v1 [Gossypium barbadense]
MAWDRLILLGSFICLLKDGSSAPITETPTSEDQPTDPLTPWSAEGKLIDSTPKLSPPSRILLLKLGLPRYLCLCSSTKSPAFNLP